jgi:hemerythrin-like metal-binding protein
MFQDMEIAVKKPFLLWRDDWQLGYECLDEQHTKIVDTLNKLHRFIVIEEQRNYENKTLLCQHLTSLSEMTRRHFKAEEVLMRAHEYPKYAEHYREHILMLAELKECIREIDSGDRIFTLGTLTALKHWQINHAIDSDRMFADYLSCQSLSGIEDVFNMTTTLVAQTG